MSKKTTTSNTKDLSDNEVMATALLIERRCQEVANGFTQNVLLSLSLQGYEGLIDALDKAHFTTFVGRDLKQMDRILRNHPQRFAEAVEILASFIPRKNVVMSLILDSTLPATKFNEIFALIENDNLKAAVEKSMSSGLQKASRPQTVDILISKQQIDEFLAKA